MITRLNNQNYNQSLASGLNPFSRVSLSLAGFLYKGDKMNGKNMKTERYFQFYGAIPKLGTDNVTVRYEVVKISRLDSIIPTECRKFQTFEQADKAARFLHHENPQYGYINMR